MAQRKKKKASQKKKAVKVKVHAKKVRTKKTSAAKKRELVNVTVVTQASFKPSESSIENWVNRVAVALQERSLRDKRLRGLDWTGAELTIAFLDQDPARALNRNFRGRDYATDVLSFSDDTPGVLGEMAICPEVVLRQAREHGLSFDEELGYMILHGMLHLLGFDHEESKAEARVMFELQDDVFNELSAELFG